MIRFCRDPNTSFFFLFTRIDKTPSGCKQTIIFPENAPQTNQQPLWKFCFPLTSILDYGDCAQACFTIYLSSVNSEPTFGYVKIKSITSDNQIAYCLLSSFFDPPKYFHIINLYLQNPPKAGLDLLKRFRQPSLQLKNLDANENNLLSTFLTELFQTIDPYLVGTILTSIVLDNKIIVISSDLSKVSRTCFALLSLIHPIPWPGVFIPVLPHHLIDTLFAPFPYIIGIHSSLSNVLQSPEMDDHVFINVDTSMAAARPPFSFPARVEKDIDTFSKTIRESKLDPVVIRAQCNKLILNVISAGLNLRTTAPKRLFNEWDKLRKLTSFSELFVQQTAQSQTILQLMRDIENGPGGEIYSAFWEPTNVGRNRNVVPVYTKAQKEICYSELLAEISKLAEAYGKKNENIEQNLMLKKKNSKSEINVNPEKLSFGRKVSIYGDPNSTQKKKDKEEEEKKEEKKGFFSSLFGRK
ncbi:DENN domain-containing protein 1B isoform X2 [Histomonas meleagridis]|uniref:DENN domain-containing protein 1B isoform X2 n=1 Tax=Histomonas meleagridis TaxID=135588 RepID=UPI00355A090D|nr:DENN domain-containing protein 1B isoform X2 [Histomonas meleagridis]KAH0802979.1 DENN domain-containing protein 1B isoform X2 [Histomonas meleagridis]